MQTVSIHNEDQEQRQRGGGCKIAKRDNAVKYTFEHALMLRRIGAATILSILD